MALGSVDYIAPEQAHGADVDARADIYSLACVLFQMLTGSVVFDRDNDLEKLWAHVHDPPRGCSRSTPTCRPASGCARSRARQEPRRSPAVGDPARSRRRRRARHSPASRWQASARSAGSAIGQREHVAGDLLDRAVGPQPSSWRARRHLVERALPACSARGGRPRGRHPRPGRGRARAAPPAGRGPARGA